MALIVCEGGLKFALDSLTAALVAGTAKLRLYQNNYTPTEADDISDYTEATFSGYAAATIGTWNAATYGGGEAEAEATTAHTFTNSTGAVGNDIYGYYVTDSAGTVLYWAQRATSPPLSLQLAGEAVTITPAITGNNP